MLENFRIWTSSFFEFCGSTKQKQKGQGETLIVGRDDGTIEVYKLGGPEALLSEPLAKATTGESITGLDVGPIRDPAVNEIIATTFSGKIFLFWDTRTLDLNDPKIREIKEKQAKALKGEVSKLREKLAHAKTLKATADAAGATTKITGENVQPANVRMSIQPSDAAYMLTVESQAEIVRIVRSSKNL